MKTEISFCPLCASKLEAGDDERYECEECESKFFIQLVEGDDEEDEDEEEEEDDDEEEDEEEEKDDEDEY